MATRQSSRNSAATQPAACPTSKIDRGPREERPVVPLSILRTHWIKERRLCAVKAYLIATHSDAPAIRARHQTGMQSHGGPQLVAELPQSLKNATASKYFGLSNVRYGSLADIGEPSGMSALPLKADMLSVELACPLCANSGHSRLAHRDHFDPRQHPSFDAGALHDLVLPCRLAKPSLCM